ncbi:MAG: hypothetical protein JKY55_10950 [Aliivibrio sp.]|nr:hypothetical protein [Aliivibrio sp.]
MSIHVMVDFWFSMGGGWSCLGNRSRHDIIFVIGNTITIRWPRSIEAAISLCSF